MRLWKAAAPLCSSQRPAPRPWGEALRGGLPVQATVLQSRLWYSSVVEEVRRILVQPSGHRRTEWMDGTRPLKRFL